MKKVLGLLAIVGFVACNNAEKEAADAAAKATADSTAKAAAEKATADSIAALAPKDTTHAMDTAKAATPAAPAEAPKH